MVQLERVQGQRGHMVIHEDGSIISSSGELSSSEATAQHILSLLSHSLPVDFNAAPAASAAPTGGPATAGNGTFHSDQDLSSGGGVGGGDSSNGNGTQDNQHVPTTGHNALLNGGGGDNTSNNQSGQVWKWNRITVDFGDHSFVTCLSNKKIHVVKRDRSHPPEVEQANNPNVPSYIG